MDRNSKAEKAYEKKREEIEAEIADILAYVLSLCAGYNIDFSKAFERKMKLNAQKCPVDQA